MTVPQHRYGDLLISCFGDDTGGGLFTYSEGRIRAIDCLRSGGMSASAAKLRRVLSRKTTSGTTCRILTYFADTLLCSAELVQVVDPHDIVEEEDGLLIVSTGTNEIIKIAEDGKISTFWHATGAGNSWHINCLGRINGRLVVSAFGRFTDNREWKDHMTDGSGLIHDLESGTDLVSGLCCPHNPAIVGDQLLICNSANYELLAYDLSTLRLKRKIKLGGWTRGLAFDESHIFIGVSSPRDFPGVSDHAYVEILDRTTWSVVGSVELPCREIYSLAVVRRTNGTKPAWWLNRMVPG